jgi:hypothetical protein
MPRITLPVTPIASRRFISALQQTIDLRDSLERTKDIMDEITAGGTNKAALETAVEVIGSGSPLTAGQGAILYDAVVTLYSGPNAVGVRSVIKQFDQG